MSSSTDEGIRPTPRRDAGQAEAGVQAEDGKVTAGNSSQITDGAVGAC